MSSMRIGTRLVGGTTILIAIAAAIGYLGYSDVQHIAETSFPQLTALTETRGAIRGILVGERGLINRRMMEPTVRAAQWTFIETNTKKLADSMATYEGLPMGAAEKAAWASIVDTIGTWKRAHAEVADIHREKDRLFAAGAKPDDSAIDTLDQRGLEASLRARTAWLPCEERLTKAINEMSISVKTEADSTKQQLLVFTLVGGLLAFVLGVFLTRSITGPVQAMIARLKDMAEGEGDLTKRLELKTNDELGEMAKWFDTLVDRLHELIRDISGNAGTLAASSTELSAISSETAANAGKLTSTTTTVAAAAEEASSNTASVAKSMEETTRNLSSVASATEEMSATIGDIAANSEKARGISSDATEQAQAISTMMKGLGQAAQEIGKVTETITSISAQTNLLALNATIEAARAGAAGKGFAVVANEIKELAQQTAAATEDIKSKIAGIQSATGGAITDIEKISQVIRDVGGIVSSIAASIEEQATVTKDVAGNIAQASAGVRDANERVSQTATVSNSIAKEVSLMSAGISEMAEGNKQVQTSAAELSQLSEQLKQKVGRFKI